jgi:hypothetical protein
LLFFAIFAPLPAFFSRETAWPYPGRRIVGWFRFAAVKPRVIAILVLFLGGFGFGFGVKPRGCLGGCLGGRFFNLVAIGWFGFGSICFFFVVAI